MNGKARGVVLEVIKTPESNRVVSAYPIDRKTYNKLVDISGRPDVPPSTPFLGGGAESGISGFQKSTDLNISKANEVVKPQAIKGVEEVKIPVRPSIRLASQVQAAPGEVSFRPGQPKRPTQKLPISPARTAKILEKDSLPVKYNKLGKESSIIKEEAVCYTIGVSENV